MVVNRIRRFISLSVAKTIATALVSIILDTAIPSFTIHLFHRHLSAVAETNELGRDPKLVPVTFSIHLK